MIDIVMVTLIGVIVFGIFIGILILRNNILYKRSNDAQGDVDYRAFYVMGITYLGAGVALSFFLRNPGFFGLTGIGLLYMFIGLKNHDKW